MKTLILNPKSEEQKHRENSILSLLKEGTRNPRIKFPDYIYFRLEGNTLNIEIVPSIRNTGTVNYACENMQSDNAAFEGWAICLKAWIEEIQNVTLRWAIPEVEQKNPHYNRFLYRVLKFIEFYDWFSVENDMIQELDLFKSQLVDLSNNSGSKDPKEPTSKGEKYLEYSIVHKYAEEFKKEFKVTSFNHQLPVGVKKNKDCFFTGRASAIDLWGINDNAISIFELKYQNKMVGIISELFLYTNIIHDMISGMICPPDPSICIRPSERELYTHLSKFTQIKAYMLSEEEFYHPLLSDKVLTLLNDNNLREDKIGIEFIKACTPENWFKNIK